MSWLKNDPDETWRRFGAEEPYYGVLTSERFRRSNLNDAHRAEFFQTGEKYVEEVLAQSKRAFHDGLPMGRALDFGCGVGRLTIPLALLFEQVTAVDISPAMIEEARINCCAYGIENVTFVLSDDALTRVEGAYDFINAYIVFEHIEEARGLRLIQRLLGLLGPGGVAVIDLCTKRHESGFRRVGVWLKKRFLPLHYLHNLVQGRAMNGPLIQVNVYDVNAVLSLALDAGMRDSFVTLKRHRTDRQFDRACLYLRQPAP